MLDALPLQRYLQITGESANTVYTRRSRGVWREGIEIFRPEGGDLWVSLSGVQAWLRGHNRPVPDLTGRLKAQMKIEQA